MSILIFNLDISRSYCHFNTCPSPTELPRRVAIESSSSKKSTHGADCRALSNISRTFASLSPNHMVRSSGPFTLIKLAWHSLAIAFASSLEDDAAGDHLHEIQLLEASYLCFSAFNAHLMQCPLKTCYALLFDFCSLL